jgi:hypothetical protein
LSVFGEQVFRRYENGVYISGTIKYLKGSCPGADQDGRVAALHFTQGWHTHSNPGSKQRLGLVPPYTLGPQPGTKILQFRIDLKHRITV